MLLVGMAAWTARYVLFAYGNGGDLVWMLVSAGMTMREHLRVLRIEPRRLASHTMKLQDQILRDMLAGAAGRRGLKGLINPTKGIGPRVLDFIHPPGGDAALPAWHRATLGLWKRGAILADRALA